MSNRMWLHPVPLRTTGIQVCLRESLGTDRKQLVGPNRETRISTLTDDGTVRSRNGCLRQLLELEACFGDASGRYFVLTVKTVVRVLSALALAVLTAASIRVGSREGTPPTRGGWRPVDPDS